MKESFGFQDCVPYIQEYKACPLQRGFTVNDHSTNLLKLNFQLLKNQISFSELRIAS